MPMMGCCSAVVAAACFAPLGRRRVRSDRREDGEGNADEVEEEGNTDIAAGPLSWGVIRQVVERHGVDVEEKMAWIYKGGGGEARDR